MNTSQYKTITIGDKVKLLRPMSSNSGGVLYPADTILEVIYKTPRVRQSQGLPWFFWNCALPGQTFPLVGICNPNEIDNA